VLVALAGLGVGAMAAGSCAPAPKKMDARHIDDGRREIAGLSIQIREWRREAGLDVEPRPDVVTQMHRMSMTEARDFCPEHQQPATETCQDVCDLSDAICDNAERICRIATDLKPDPWADEKCDSAKASCKDAKERCCACNGSEAAEARWK
jgi:hypothetical protein